MIQPTAKDVAGGQVTVRPQKCGIGGRCNACVVGALVKGCQITVINSSPPGTMGEMQEVPPVIQDDAFHVYELAAAQERDLVISWFVDKVITPLANGKHVAALHPEAHPEARQMFHQRKSYKISTSGQFGKNKLLVYQDK